mgnify:CR=1 FL=1
MKNLILSILVLTLLAALCLPFVSSAEEDGETVLLPKESEWDYVIYEYENETLLHETGLVPPGYRVQWNAKEALSVGVHELKIVVDCYDVETRAACDGATTHCVVTVE